VPTPAEVFRPFGIGLKALSPLIVHPKIENNSQLIGFFYKTPSVSTKFLYLETPQKALTEQA
jgi:hypothetical protein